MEFSVLKTRIKVSPLFFSVLTAFLLFDKNGISLPVILFSSLHETGHFLALLYVKSRPKCIKLSLFGIEMELPENLSTAKKCFVLMAGFLTNFIFAALFFSYGKTVFGYINLAIGFFTALPLSATDGGAFLKTLLDEYFPQKGDKIFRTVACSLFVAVSVIIAFLAVNTRNIFLLTAVFYMSLCIMK